MTDSFGNRLPFFVFSDSSIGKSSAGSLMLEPFLSPNAVKLPYSFVKEPGARNVRILVSKKLDLNLGGSDLELHSEQFGADGGPLPKR